MNTFTKTIFLIGKHANLHRKTFLEHNSSVKIVTINYEPGNPFNNEPNVVSINEEKVEFKNDYNLEELSSFFKMKMPYYWNNFESVLLIGDPSELIFQSFLLVKNAYRSNLTYHADSVNLFIYPIGMLALNIRKELAHLMYDIKKHNIPTFLIRKEEKDLSRIFSIILSTNDVLSFQELADEIKGLEQLVHPSMSAIMD